MPFLNEKEWNLIIPYIGNEFEEVKAYRKKHQCSLNTARFSIKQDLTKLFEKLTGEKDVHFETIYHHRLLDWGSECKSCGYLLRTPKAKMCAKCGYRPEIEIPLPKES
jgi:rRNA maturation endonuclease Nob1